MATLYHVSAWSDLATKNVGEKFVLKPGTQNAEGVGVYFAEGVPSVKAADGVRFAQPTAIIAIDANDNAGWWQSKASKARKFGKPRTWHSSNKYIVAQVKRVETINLDGLVAPVLHCTWQFQ